MLIEDCHYRYDCLFNLRGSSFVFHSFGFNKLHIGFVLDLAIGNCQIALGQSFTIFQCPSLSGPTRIIWSIIFPLFRVSISPTFTPTFSPTFSTFTVRSSLTPRRITPPLVLENATMSSSIRGVKCSLHSTVSP